MLVCCNQSFKYLAFILIILFHLWLYIHAIWMMSQRLSIPSDVVACFRPTFSLWSITTSMFRTTIPWYVKCVLLGQYFNRRPLSTSMEPDHIHVHGIRAGFRAGQTGHMPMDPHQKGPPHQMELRPPQKNAIGSSHPP